MGDQEENLHYTEEINVTRELGDWGKIGSKHSRIHERDRCSGRTGVGVISYVYC